VDINESIFCSGVWASTNEECTTSLRPIGPKSALWADEHVLMSSYMSTCSYTHAGRADEHAPSYAWACAHPLIAQNCIRYDTLKIQKNSDSSVGRATDRTRLGGFFSKKCTYGTYWIYNNVWRQIKKRAYWAYCMMSPLYVTSDKNRMYIQRCTYRTYCRYTVPTPGGNTTHYNVLKLPFKWSSGNNYSSLNYSSYSQAFCNVGIAVSYMVN
jgi:hypothetical protein